MIRYLQAQYIVFSLRTCLCTSFARFRLARSRKIQVSQKNGGCTLSQRYGWLAGVAHSQCLGGERSLKRRGWKQRREKQEEGQMSRQKESKYVFEPSRTNSRIQKPMTEYCQTWGLVFTARSTGQTLTYASERPSGPTRSTFFLSTWACLSLIVLDLLHPEGPFNMAGLS